MAQLVKVLLAEGHQPIKDIIIKEVSGLENVRLLGCVLSGKDLLQFLNNTDEAPDVVIMDTEIDLDEEFNYSKVISERYPEIRLIALAEADESLYIRKMLAHGANGYILKDDCNEGLSELLEFHREQGPAHIQFSYTENRTDTQNEVSNRSVLDQREREVLKLMMNQYSSLEISEKLSMNRSELHDTLDRVHEKTNSTNPLELRRYAIRHSIY